MARGLAEDLLLLCRDDQQGAEHRFCWKTVDIGVAGALVADAALSGLVAVEQGRARPGERSEVPPLLAAVAPRCSPARPIPARPTPRQLVLGGWPSPSARCSGSSPTRSARPPRSAPRA